ncbi:MAG: VanZ family protein [Acidobacteriota bacterium]
MATPTSPGARRLWLWGPVALYMALIFGVSAMSAPPSPLPAHDKIEHYLAYGGLGTLALRAAAGGTLAGLSGGAAAAAWGIAAAYGISDEYHQSFVPDRTSDAADALADAAGAATAVLGFWAFGIIVRSRRPSGAALRRP